MRNLKNKACTTCKNAACRVEYMEKIGLDENGMPNGTNCLGWMNEELIGKSRILQIYDVNELS